MRLRGFEIITSYKGQQISLPQRKTSGSAGYDIEAAADYLLEPGHLELVTTGLKAYMCADEYLGIFIRSGISVKHQIICVNGQGIIDADYYNNSANEGHIMIPLLNLGQDVVRINKGMRIAQGIFYIYLVVDNDVSGQGTIRTGGFGSTGGI